MATFIHRELRYAQEHPFQVALLGSLVAVGAEIGLGLAIERLIDNTNPNQLAGPTIGQQFGLVQIPLAAILGAAIAFAATTYASNRKRPAILCIMACSIPLVAINFIWWTEDARELGNNPRLATLYLPLIIQAVIATACGIGLAIIATVFFSQSAQKNHDRTIP